MRPTATEKPCWRACEKPLLSRPLPNGRNLSHRSRAKQRSANGPALVHSGSLSNRKEIAGLPLGPGEAPATRARGSGSSCKRSEKLWLADPRKQSRHGQAGNESENGPYNNIIKKRYDNWPYRAR